MRGTSRRLPDAGIDVLDGVASLVDKSLLQQREDADGRAALSACWRRSASSRWSSWRRAAKRTPCAPHTAPHAGHRRARRRPSRTAPTW